MINKIKQSINQAGSLIKEQASAFGEAARQKGDSILNDWISILPKLKEHGLDTTFFAVSVSINPTLDVELQGEAKKFNIEYIEQILKEAKGNTPLKIVFNSIKTALQLYKRTDFEPLNPLIVRLKVRLSPEVRVSYGEQLME
ncbi:MAG TPA: hypothetical protein ENJ20_07955 [Bacteroidetes bacterium]|nr:hypothetical protein [Bacteroidota bacterium]